MARNRHCRELQPERDRIQHGAFGDRDDDERGWQRRPTSGTRRVAGMLIADVTTSMTFPASIDAGNSVVGHVVYNTACQSRSYHDALRNLAVSASPIFPAALAIMRHRCRGFTGMPATATSNTLNGATSIVRSETRQVKPPATRDSARRWRSVNVL